MFSKGFSVEVVKSRDCVVKSKLFIKEQNFRLVQIESVTDNKLNVGKTLKFLCDGVENIVGKGENGTSIFSFSHNVFSSLFFAGSSKVRIVG